MDSRVVDLEEEEQDSVEDIPVALDRQGPTQPVLLARHLPAAAKVALAVQVTTLSDLGLTLDPSTTPRSCRRRHPTTMPNSHNNPTRSSSHLKARRPVFQSLEG